MSNQTDRLNAALAGRYTGLGGAFVSCLSSVAERHGYR
jgi:hypothetical protein